MPAFKLFTQARVFFKGIRRPNEYGNINNILGKEREEQAQLVNISLVV